MRYLLTTNALRPVVAGGSSYSFEPALLRGGMWLGILAADDELAASILASGDPNVGEILFERYDSLKKKLTASSPNSQAQRSQPVEHPGVTVAEPAAHRIAPTIAKEPAPTVASAIELTTTSNQPPDEPLLAGAARKKR